MSNPSCSSSPSPPPSILRTAGGDEDVVRSLRDALVSHFDSSTSSSSSSSPPPGGGSTADNGGAGSTVMNSASGLPSNTASLLKINNRYFEADVRLEPVLDGDDGRTTPNPTATPRGQGHEDGVLLVFFDGKGAGGSGGGGSFDALSFHHEEAERLGRAGDLLRLCVGVTALPGNGGCVGTEVGDDERDREAEYSRRVLWCLDRGYEYVGGVDLTTSGVSSGHDERDKDGFARVAEAVGSAVWTSARMHPRKAGRLQAAFGEDKRKVTTSENSASSEAAGGEEDGGMELPTPSASADLAGDSGANGSSRDDGGTTRTSQAKVNGSADDSTARADAAMEALTLGEKDFTGGGGEGEDDEEERALDSLHSLVGEATRIRESAMQGHFSDEERRERAAQAAMKLVGMLDSFGNDDDDDDEDDGSSDGGGNEGEDVEDVSGKVAVGS